MTLKRFILIFGFLFFLINLNTNLFAKSKKLNGKGLFIGERIPSFNLKTEEDKVIKFDEEFKNKVLLLSFSNYCTMDLAGIETAPSYYKFYNNRDFKFVFIFSRDCLPSFIPNFFVKKKASMTVSTLKLPYILLDFNEATLKKFRGSQINSHIYVIDKEGKVAWKKILTIPKGYTREINKVIDKLIK